MSLPPEPDFREGVRAEPTSVVAAPPTAAEWIDPSDVEADIGDDIDLDPQRWFSIDDTGAPVPDPAGWDRFDEALAERLVPANTSASVAVMVDGRIVHAAAFGERIEGSGELVEPSDRFRVASISKTITAIVVLRLAEEGLIGLDEPVGSLLAEHLMLDDVDPDALGVTVRALLNHTSGFPPHDAIFFGNGSSSCREAASIGLRRDVRPAGGAQYSNMNYCVLGMLVEAVTGRPYEQVVDERLLAPLGIVGMRMTGTYELGPDEVWHAPGAGRNFMETLGAAGAWNATPSDLVTILDSIDPATPGRKVLTARTSSEMRVPVDNRGERRGYGLGVIDYGGGTWGHTGTLQNAFSMAAVESDGFTWAITVSGGAVGDSDRLRSVFRRSIADAFG